MAKLHQLWVGVLSLVESSSSLLTFAGMRNHGRSPFLVPLASDGEGGVERVILSLERLPKGFALMAVI